VANKDWRRQVHGKEGTASGPGQGEYHTCVPETINILYIHNVIKHTVAKVCLHYPLKIMLHAGWNRKEYSNRKKMKPNIK